MKAFLSICSQQLAPSSLVPFDLIFEDILERVWHRHRTRVELESLEAPERGAKQRLAS